MTEISISLDTFEDTHAEPSCEFFVGAIQVRISREKAVFGEANCAERRGASRRCLQIALGQSIGIGRKLGMNVEIDQHNKLSHNCALLSVNLRRQHPIP